jgi:hypothetical protein
MRSSSPTNAMSAWCDARVMPGTSTRPPAIAAAAKKYAAVDASGSTS